MRDISAKKDAEIAEIRARLNRAMLNNYTATATQSHRLTNNIYF
jgi:hypothetical protein